MIHPDSSKSFTETKSRRHVSEETLLSGPLGRVLQATVGQRLQGSGRGTLHLINIRDWHAPGDQYDRERRIYGSHCDAGTWALSTSTG